jgi:hypothetical protein
LINRLYLNNTDKLGSFQKQPKLSIMPQPTITLLTKNLEEERVLIFKKQEMGGLPPSDMWISTRATKHTSPFDKGR